MVVAEEIRRHARRGLRRRVLAAAPELAERGDLTYLAVTSLDAAGKIAPALRAAHDLGAIAIDVQLGDYDSRVADMVKLAVRIRAVAHDLGDWRSGGGRSTHGRFVQVTVDAQLFPP